MHFNDIVNITSLIASSIGSLILFSLAFSRPKLMKRVSLQLQTGIALLDITRHIHLYTVLSPENGFCTFVAFYGFFSDHLYVLLNVAIALNLHLFLLKRYQPRHCVIWIYFVVSIGISLVFDLVPLGLGYMGDSSMGSCYLKPGIANLQLVKLFIVHIINWPGIIYCLIVSVIVIKEYIFGKVGDSETDIVWLPEVRGLSFMIGVLYDVFGYESMALFRLSGFGLRSTGTLNLICLLLDYQVWFAIIGCAFPRKPPHPSNYELKDERNNDETSAKNQNRNPILDQPSSCIPDYSERENLINFL